MAEEKQQHISHISADITVAVVVLIFALGFFGAYFDAIFERYRELLDWWYGQNWSALYSTASIIFTVLDVLLFGFVIFTLRQHAKLIREIPEKEAATHQVPLDEEVNKNWREIQSLMHSQNPSDWSIAIIRADGLLDEVLQEQGYEGATMAERLKIISRTEMPSLERVWSAHRMRNTIVHEAPKDFPREDIQHAIESFELALRELGAMVTKKAPAIPEEIPESIFANEEDLKNL